MSGHTKSKIEEDLKSAMKSRDKVTVSALRLILAALKQKEIDTRLSLNENDITSILGKLAKQRKDSISQYTSASRTDLAAIEENELRIINSYLPKQLSTTEIEKKVFSAIKQVDAKTPKDIGKVMSKLKPELQGTADMALVSQIIKDNL